MCIAIMKSANKKISKSTLRRCYDANPDGAGFMYAEDKQLDQQLQDPLQYNHRKKF